MKYLLLLWLLLFSEVHAQTASLKWAKSFSGVGDTYGMGVALDAAGYIYTTGYLYDTVDFDPGPGVYNLSSTYGNSYITKLDSSGHLIWAKTFGDSGHLDFGRIYIDKNDNIYLAGSIQGTVDVDPGPGVNILNSPFPEYIILKLDTSANLVWVKHFPGGVAAGLAMAFDAEDNLFVTGIFHQSIDFDPGPGTFTMSPIGNGDIFIHKLTSSGDFVWAKKIGGATLDIGLDIALDATDNIYVLGDYSSTVDFVPGNSIYNMTDNGYGDIFILKLDNIGNFSWVKSVGGTLYDAPGRMIIDSLSNIYLTGTFRSIVDFDPGPATFSQIASGEFDGFLMKLDSAGQFQWAQKFGSIGRDEIGSLGFDSAGNILITGFFSDTVDFNAGTGVAALASAGDIDACIVKLSPNGHYIWSAQVGGAGSDGVTAIVNDANDNILVTGYFSDTTDFDPSRAVYNLVSGGNTDAFVAKFTETDLFIWEGTVSNAWHNGDNWNTGVVPNEQSRVIIPPETPFNATVSISTEIKSMQIDPGAVATVKQGINLKISGTR